MTHEEQTISIQLSKEAFQIGLAHNLAEQLNINGHDDIDAEDILDCMAVANCHLEAGGEISSKAYFKVLEIGRLCNES